MNSPSNEPKLFRQINIQNEYKCKKLMASFGLNENEDYFICGKDTLVGF